MKEDILKEVIEWCEKQEGKPNFYIEDFVDVVINKTAEKILEEVKNEFKKEFEKGNLKQSFIISNDYYLYLKLKEIANKILKPDKDPDYIENDKEIK